MMRNSNSFSDKGEVKLQPKSRQELLLEIENKDELLMSKELENQHNRLVYNLDLQKFKDQVRQLKAENKALKEELRRVKNPQTELKKSTSENSSLAIIRGNLSGRNAPLNIFSQKNVTVSNKETRDDHKPHVYSSRVPIG